MRFYYEFQLILDMVYFCRNGGILLDNDGNVVGIEKAVKLYMSHNYGSK